MNKVTVDILSQHVIAQLERLTMLREYQQNIKDPYVTAALSLLINETQDAIARVSSRLRQLGTISTHQITDETSTKLLHQSRSRRALADRLTFVGHGLKHQLEWDEVHLKKLSHDPTSYALFLSLSQQARAQLDRWNNFMIEMKVSPE